MKSTIKQIKQDEGLQLKPYHCTSGKLTIGYGRNLESNGITQEEAEILLNNDLKNITYRLQTIEVFEGLNTARQSVLIQMCFQLGFGGLMKFKKMWNAIENKHYTKASEEMLDSRWRKQTPERSKRLAKQMKTGIWT